MDTYHVVLYIHFLSLALGFMGAGIMFVCLLGVRNAQTVTEAGPWGAVAGTTEKVFPVSIIGLFATGAYMTSDLWSWDTPWIELAILGLVIITLQGPLIAGRRSHVLKHALMENGPGPLTGNARAMTRDFAMWLVTFTNPLMVLGIMWMMTEKPGRPGAIAALVISYVVGVVLAWLMTRPQPAASVAAEPTT